MTPTTSQILTRHDAGDPAATIAHALKLSASTVYTVLRTHRPRRTRKPRERTSAVRLQILALLRSGTGAAEAASLLGCSRAYVYRVKAESVAISSQQRHTGDDHG